MLYLAGYVELSGEEEQVMTLKEIARVDGKDATLLFSDAHFYAVAIANEAVICSDWAPDQIQALKWSSPVVRLVEDPTNHYAIASNVLTDGTVLSSVRTFASPRSTRLYIVSHTPRPRLVRIVDFPASASELGIPWAICQFGSGSPFVLSVSSDYEFCEADLKEALRLQ